MALFHHIGHIGFRIRSGFQKTNPYLLGTWKLKQKFFPDIFEENFYVYFTLTFAERKKFSHRPQHIGHNNEYLTVYWLFHILYYPQCPTYSVYNVRTYLHYIWLVIFLIIHWTFNILQRTVGTCTNVHAYAAFQPFRKMVEKPYRQPSEGYNTFAVVTIVNRKHELLSCESPKGQLSVRDWFAKAI